MKTHIKLAAALALALGASGSPAADTVCKNCEYKPFAGAYLGAYWLSDRGTFQRSSIRPWLDEGVNHFDDFWVLDVNAGGALRWSLSSKLKNVRASIYFDAGSVCSPGGNCGIAYEPSVVLAGDVASFEVSLNPGRYVVIVHGDLPPLADGSYKGRVTIR